MFFHHKDKIVKIIFQNVGSQKYQPLESLEETNQEGVNGLGWLQYFYMVLEKQNFGVELLSSQVSMSLQLLIVLRILEEKRKYFTSA